MTQPPATLTPEQFAAALSAIEGDFHKQVAELRETYTARMTEEAWGDPARAAALQREWDAAIEAARADSRQSIDELPRTPRKEVS